MSKSYFFYGVVDGDLKEDSWQALHDHFEKLARENDARATEIVISDRKAKRRSVEHDGL